MSTDAPEKLIGDMRGVRYCEVIDTTATVASVLQDEFENSYTLPH